MSVNDDKKNKTQGYGASKDLVCKKEEIKCNNIIKQYKND